MFYFHELNIKSCHTEHSIYKSAFIHFIILYFIKHRKGGQIDAHVKFVPFALRLNFLAVLGLFSEINARNSNGI